MARITAGRSTDFNSLSSSSSAVKPARVIGIFSMCLITQMTRPRTGMDHDLVPQLRSTDPTGPPIARGNAANRRGGGAQGEESWGGPALAGLGVGGRVGGGP